MLALLLEVVVRAVLQFIMLLLVIVPATVAVFIYQLVARRSFVEAGRIASKVASDMLKNGSFSSN